MIHANRPQTTAAVAAHYDELDPFYREVWGEHVHHGLWATGRESRLAATDALVDLVASRLDLAPGLALCDIGCGYGATAVRLAERRGVHVTGVTVSGVQAAIAAAKSPSHGSIAVLHRDWLSNGFPDRQFDRAYAIESSEHMPDKRRFFAEAYRTLRPGGRLAVCAWLVRDRPSPGKPATCSSLSAAKVACLASATKPTTGVSRLQPGSPWPTAKISAPASAAPLVRLRRPARRQAHQQTALPTLPVRPTRDRSRFDPDPAEAPARLANGVDALLLATVRQRIELSSANSLVEVREGPVASLKPRLPERTNKCFR